MQELHSTADIFTALGGMDAVAALTRRKTKAVWAWKYCGTFPADTYLVMATALSARGFSADPSLWRQIPPGVSP